MIRHRETRETDLSLILFPSPGTFSSQAPSPGLGGVGAQPPIPDIMPLDAGSARQTPDALQAEERTVHPAAPGAWIITLASRPRACATRGDALEARSPSPLRANLVPHPKTNALTAVAGGEWELGLSGLSHPAAASPPWLSRAPRPSRRPSSFSTDAATGGSVCWTGRVSDGRSAGVRSHRVRRTARSACISSRDGSRARASAICWRKVSSSAGMVGPMQPESLGFTKRCPQSICRALSILEVDCVRWLGRWLARQAWPLRRSGLKSAGLYGAPMERTEAGGYARERMHKPWKTIRGRILRSKSRTRRVALDLRKSWGSKNAVSLRLTRPHQGVA